MQAPFLLTQSKKLHNDSMWKNLKVISPYKIVVVHTYILNFLTHWPPPGCLTLLLSYKKNALFQIYHIFLSLAIIDPFQPRIIVAHLSYFETCNFTIPRIVYQFHISYVHGQTYSRLQKRHKTTHCITEYCDQCKANGLAFTYVYLYGRYFFFFFFQLTTYLGERILDFIYHPMRSQHHIIVFPLTKFNHNKKVVLPIFGNYCIPRIQEERISFISKLFLTVSQALWQLLTCSKNCF